MDCTVVLTISKPCKWQSNTSALSTMLWLFQIGLYNTVSHQSKLEQEALNLAGNLQQRIRRTDRAVIIGFLLSITPVFPACVVGLMLCIINYVLIRSQKLPENNRKIVKIGMVSGLILTISWIFVFMLIDPLSTFSTFIDNGYNILSKLFKSLWIQSPISAGVAV